MEIKRTKHQKPMIPNLELAASKLMIPYRKILDAKFAANLDRWETVITLMPQASQELRSIADIMDEALNEKIGEKLDER